jgi:hypothetical protein
MNASDIKRLLTIIEQQLDWGEALSWQSRDFELLNQLILEKTKVSLSESTLRRIWGRVEYNHLPSTTTLDTLARFADFENWRAFIRHSTAGEKQPAVAASGPAFKRKAGPGWWITAALAAMAAVGISLVSMHVKKSPEHAKAKYLFSSKPVTRDIPNSVIFTYNAQTMPGDSVFIQQSWDQRTREKIDPDQHQYTSVYFHPGFYHAKLVVNNTVVKEHSLLIPTKAWLGLIDHEPIPVYLSPQEFLTGDLMSLPVPDLKRKNIPLTPQPPAVEFANVGNFAPVPIRDFNFSAEVRNDYHEGSGTCQFTNIDLITDNIPLIMPLSAKGCIGELNMIDGENMISGKHTDLSGFGTELTKWVKVNIRSAGDKIQYYVNDKLAYESKLPKPENIVGMAYMFQGTGSVKNIELRQGNKIIFKAF